MMLKGLFLFGCTGTLAWRRLLTDDNEEVSLMDAWMKYEKEIGVHKKGEWNHEGLTTNLFEIDPITLNERYDNFKEAYKLVQEHNKRYAEGKETYDMKINEFADLSDEEMEHFSSLLGNAGDESEQVMLTSVSSSPQMIKKDGDSVQWKTDNLKIKSQGGCGSCWAFAAASMVENRLYWARGWQDVSLSTQELVDCSHAGSSCRGGLMHHAVDHIQNYGVASESQYKYIANSLDFKQACGKSDVKKTLRTGDVISMKQRPSGEDDLEEIVRTGAVAFGMWIERGFHYYNTGVYNPSSCPRGNSAHAMVVVGFTKDYWIIQNSWGTGFGMNGYMYMKKGGNKCEIGTAPWNWSYAALPSYSSMNLKPIGGGRSCGTIKNYGEHGACQTTCPAGTSKVCKWHSGCNWYKQCGDFGANWSQQNSKLCRRDGWLYGQEQCCQCLAFDPKSPLSTYHDHGSCGPRGNDAKASFDICGGKGYRQVAKIRFTGWQNDFIIDGCRYWSFTQYECNFSKDQRRRMEERLNADGTEADSEWTHAASVDVSTMHGKLAHVSHSVNVTEPDYEQFKALFVEE